MKTSDFMHTMEFTAPKGVVYVFFAIKAGKEIPFYIGETGGFVARMGNYHSASFGATTDFKVGEAAKYLLNKGCRVVVAYNEHDARRTEERRLCDEARKLFSILNDIDGYDYRLANREQQRKEIQQWCDEHLLAENSN